MENAINGRGADTKVTERFGRSADKNDRKPRSEVRTQPEKQRFLNTATHNVNNARRTADTEKAQKIESEIG